MERETVTQAGQSPQAGRIMKDTGGKYRWVYELPMLKSLFLLLEVWKALGLAVAAVAIIGTVVSLLSGGGADGVLGVVQSTLVTAAIIFVLSVPAYLIVTKANNGLRNRHSQEEPKETQRLRVTWCLDGILGEKKGDEGLLWRSSG